MSIKNELDILLELEKLEEDEEFPKAKATQTKNINKVVYKYTKVRNVKKSDKQHNRENFE